MTDTPESHPAAPTAPTLAAKLNRLFATVHPPGRAEFTLDEVASAINQQGETTITTAYLSQLRRGQRTNPSRNVLAALAWFFGVSPGYFFDDAVAQRIAAELDLMVAMRDASVRQIALRAADLSPESLRNLAALIDHWRALESGGPPSRPRPAAAPPDE